MNDIHDTLGGGNPAPSTSSMHPSYPPPHGPHPETTEDLASLRAQLADTQTLISSSVSRVISLEGRLHEQENVRREVEELRERLAMLAGQVEYRSRLEEEDEASDDDDKPAADDDDDEEAEDDDDTRSISTVRASSSSTSRRKRNGGRKQQQQRQRGGGANGRLTGAEEDGNDNDNDNETRDAQDTDDGEHERGRPVTPEPGSQPREASAPHRLRAADPERADDESAGLLQQQLVQQLADTQRVLAHNTTLVARLDTLHSELDGVLEVSRSLRTQHESALSTVTLLESRVAELEGKVTEAEGKWAVWKQTMEDTWRRERESWNSERERMKSVVKEWEEAKRRAEEEEEERRLNEEEGPDDLGWMADGGSGGGDGSNSSSGGPGGSASSSGGSGAFDGSEGGGTLQGGQARFLARHGHDRSGSPTPNASPDTKGRYSSLRHLLNPLGGGGPANGRTAHARGSVPSSFLRRGGGVEPAVGTSNGNGAPGPSSDGTGSADADGGGGHPLRKSASASTIKAPSPAFGGRPGAAKDELVESGAGVSEEDGRQTERAGLAASAVATPPSPSLSSSQLQGCLVVGVAVVAIALNYDRLAGFVRS
jgi:hypothetical protein